MSYQVIARKYRPQCFADVVGQDHVIQTLANAIRQNRIAHAYLFVGPRGTGKTTIARIFSKCLNCTGGPKIDFDEKDPRCIEISEGRSLDVLEIDGASNRGIEEIRALRETVKFVPATSRFKIYIIDEVHMLTKEAFNALLKTLEEPPSHVKFMFATTEPEKVLPTILSRCQRHDLRRIPISLIVKHLAYISTQEGVGIEEAALQAVARGADGCMRDAESTLDQLISFCGNQIMESDVLSMFGLTSRSQIQDLAGSILTGNADAMFRKLHDLVKNGKDLGRLLNDLLLHFRNLLLYQAADGATDLLEITESEETIIKQQVFLSPLDVLTRIMEILAEAEARLRDASSKRIWVEVALMKAVQSRQSTSLDVVLRKLHQMRADTGSTSGSSDTALKEPAPVTTSAKTTPKSTVIPIIPPQQKPVTIPATIALPATVDSVDTAPEPSVTQPVTPSGNDALLTVWQNILDAVGRVSPFTRSYLQQANPISIKDKLFTIGFDPSQSDSLELIDNPKNRSLIQSKLVELGYPDIKIRFIKTSGTSPATQSSSSAPIPGMTDPNSTKIASKPEIITTAPISEPHMPAKEALPPTESKEIKEVKPPTVTISKEEFLNDPLIKEALDFFKGHIVEVRSTNES